jgi:hypothetical protein
LQGSLLVLCIAYKMRQRRMGIDDWGREIRSGLEGEVAAGGDDLDVVPEAVAERRSLIERSSPSRKR